MEDQSLRAHLARLEAEGASEQDQIDLVRAEIVLLLLSLDEMDTACDRPRDSYEERQFARMAEEFFIRRDEIEEVMGDHPNWADRKEPLPLKRGGKPRLSPSLREVLATADKSLAHWVSIQAVVPPMNNNPRLVAAKEAGHWWGAWA